MRKDDFVIHLVNSRRTFGGPVVCLYKLTSLVCMSSFVDSKSTHQAAVKDLMVPFKPKYYNNTFM